VAGDEVCYPWLPCYCWMCLLQLWSPLDHLRELATLTARKISEVGSICQLKTFFTMLWKWKKAYGIKKPHSDQSRSRIPLCLWSGRGWRCGKNKSQMTAPVECVDWRENRWNQLQASIFWAYSPMSDTRLRGKCWQWVTGCCAARIGRHPAKDRHQNGHDWTWEMLNRKKPYLI